MKIPPFCSRWLPLLVLGLAGCDLPGKPNPAHQEKPPSEVMDFNDLYKANCSGCHGADGNLGVAPPLDDPVFLDIVPAQELYDVIRRGRKGTPMPAFAQDEGGPLTTPQVHALAEGIKKRWKAGHLKGKVPGYRTKEGGSPAQGARVFERACAMCHGDNGQGATNGALNDAAFLALISNQALRRLAITGRPDLGMPDYQSAKGRKADFSPLSSDEITDLVAFLASWRTASGASKQ
jgi:mono/diheme cytochrome c family protein